MSEIDKYYQVLGLKPRASKEELNPEKDIGIQKIKKTSFGLEVSVI
jgi:hypothetical protein